MSTIPYPQVSSETFVFSPPPLWNPPPPRGGTITLAQKAWKISGSEGAKENFYKAPKLIYTVILWYRFVVPPPPPQGGNQPDKRGGISSGGRVFSFRDSQPSGLAVNRPLLSGEYRLRVKVCLLFIHDYVYMDVLLAVWLPSLWRCARLLGEFFQWVNQIFFLP